MSRSRLSRLRPVEASQLLWIRSLEEADSAGLVIPGALRTAASREADTEDDASFLTRRAAILTNQLPAALQVPPVPKKGCGWVQRLPEWTPSAVCGGAFLIGISANHLGPAHLINILSFPLLGLIAWNLGVCFVALAGEWKTRRLPALKPTIRPARPAAAGMDAPAAASAAWQARHGEWQEPRAKARLVLAFHAAAIALALGVIGGMYLQGLSKSYTVRWESTFLTRPQVRTLTRVLLGPASLLTGIPVPEPPMPSSAAPPMDSSVAPLKERSAAPWIHLWAASAGLFIIIPRLLLINMSRRRAARMRPDYAGEFAQWLATCRSMTGGHTCRAEVLTLHFEPASRIRDAVRLQIQQRWGAHVGAEFHPPLAYGSEQLPAVTAPPQFLVVIANFSATPETDIHGALLRTLAGTTPSPERRLLVLDISAFDSRFRALPEYADRLAARRTAWEKAAGDFPVQLLS